MVETSNGRNHVFFAASSAGFGIATSGVFVGCTPFLSFCLKGGTSRDDDEEEEEEGEEEAEEEEEKEEYEEE